MDEKKINKDENIEIIILTEEHLKKVVSEAVQKGIQASIDDYIVNKVLEGVR